MTKYYFNMEKRKYLSKTMYAVYKKNGELTKDYREILNVQHEFYSELYKSDEKVKFTLQNSGGNQLSEVERIAFDEVITKEELYDAMMTLRRGRTPGCDGLTIELFYKILEDTG